MSIFEYNEAEVMVLIRADEREDGVRQGRNEGRQLTLIAQICRKLQKGKSPELIAEELEEEYDLILPICRAAAETAPNYDYEKIYDLLNKKHNN